MSSPCSAAVSTRRDNMSDNICDDRGTCKARSIWKQPKHTLGKKLRVNFQGLLIGEEGIYDFQFKEGFILCERYMSKFVRMFFSITFYI